MEYLRTIERKWQQIWKERNIYEADADPKKPKFFLTVPYPYTSGPLHIGHGRTYVLGDIIARFKRLLGFNVLFPMAFHVTGMPILSISDRISRGDRKTIDLYRTYVRLYIDNEEEVERVLESFKDPINVATFFADNIQKDFESIGLSIDWRRKFHTAEPIYNKFIEWQYYRLKDLDLLKKGTHYVRYCLLHKQPEGEDDIEDGDVNPVHIQEFVAIKFKYEDGYILASTLRPETLYGATNMWVNPNATYVKVRVHNGEIWYISRESLIKLKHQYPFEFEAIEDTIGSAFVGKYVESPLGDKLVILPASFVDPDRVTGFVYSEPADAPYDYAALMDLKRNPDTLRKYGVDPSILDSIKPKKIIEVKGISGLHAEYVINKYNIKNQLDPSLQDATEEVYREQFYNGTMNENAGELAGLPVIIARDRIREKLIRENKAIIFYETSRKAVCRGKGKIIIARVDNQWFLDYSSEWWKKKTKEHFKRMLIVPEKYRKVFEDAIDWLKFRPCARLRGLGTRLPFDKEWLIESLSDSTIYMAFYTIVHIIRSSNIDPEQLTPEVFDFIFLGHGDPAAISTKTGIPIDTLEKMRRSFEYWYPNDLRHTATPHISNHLTFFIMHHIALFPEKYWPRGISLNELVICEGQKMAKSRGNVIPLVDIAKKYSADLFRLYVASSADLDGVVDWREVEVARLERSLLSFMRICLDATKIEEADTSVIEKPAVRWFLSVFYRHLENAKTLLENFKIRDYITSMYYEIINYIDKIKKRIGEHDALKAVRLILKDWIIALSPVIPHIAEEIWSRINRDPLKWSINLERWPETRKEFINERLEALEDILGNLISLGRELKRLLKSPVSSALIVVAAEWKFEVLDLLREKFLKGGTRDLKQMLGQVREKESLRKHIEQVAEILKKVFEGKIKVPEVELTQRDVYEYLQQNREHIARELDVASVEIIIEETATPDIRDRAQRSLPDRPIIVFA